jgi:hypothetical protein
LVVVVLVVLLLCNVHFKCSLLILAPFVELDTENDPASDFDLELT